MPLEIDRSILGREFDRTAYTTVTADEVYAYAASTGEPIRRDALGEIAPPTFVLRMHGRKFMPNELVEGLGRAGFDAGKDVEFGVPVRAGDTLTSSSAVHDIYEKTGRSGTMVFVVLRTVISNQRGEQVAAVDQKMMFR